MLRASSEALGIQTDLTATMGASESDSGLPHGTLLTRFAEAVVRRTDDITALRCALIEATSPEATGQAIATITAFSGLVRVADGTGIPVDDGLAAASADIRTALALDDFGGSANSQLGSISPSSFSSINALFGSS